MSETDVGQGDEHACHHDGFRHLGTFDEAPGTVQSPGVRADAQCCKITWLEELASERNTSFGRAIQPRRQGFQHCLSVSRECRSKVLFENRRLEFYSLFVLNVIVLV